MATMRELALKDGLLAAGAELPKEWVRDRYAICTRWEKQWRRKRCDCVLRLAAMGKYNAGRLFITLRTRHCDTEWRCSARSASVVLRGLLAAHDVMCDEGKRR